MVFDFDWNTIEPFVELGGVAVAIATGAFALGQGYGRRRWRARLRRVEDAADATKQRINEALNDAIFARAIEPQELEVIDRVRFGPKVLVFCNLKGGVGKTTLAANVGAFFADRAGGRSYQGKNVLFIDLDFQGSLSSTLANTLRSSPEMRVWSIFEPSFSPRLALNQAREIVSDRMSGCKFFDADFVLAQREERLKFDWALRNVQEDMRFRLARFLQSPEFLQTGFDLVVIDCPPRNSILTINAFVAATHVFIPSKLDLLGAAGVGLFVKSLAARDLRRLWPEMQIGAIVPTLTREEPNLMLAESNALEQAVVDANRWWDVEVSALERWIPTRVDIANASGASFAYFDGSEVTQAIFRCAGECVAKRIGYVDQDPSPGSDGGERLP